MITNLLINVLRLFIVLFISIFVHELGHLISALICRVKIEAFSIGFWKILWHKKIKGIDFRLSLLPLGGYVKLAGETDKRPNGLLSQRYLKKIFIILSGVLMNFLLACLCYKIGYDSIAVGIRIDLTILKAIIFKEVAPLSLILNLTKAQFFLIQLSLINLASAITNILPLPALDGGMIWMAWIEKLTPNYEKVIKRLSIYGFIFALLLQLIGIIYILT